MDRNLSAASADRVILQNWAGDLKLKAARSIIQTVRKVFNNCRVFREEMPSEVDKDKPMDFTNMVSFDLSCFIILDCILLSL